MLARIIPVDGPDGRPDQGLPGFGGGLPQLPGAPDNTLPSPPVGVWPPLGPNNPIVPVPPIANVPPGTIWPSPGSPARPDNSLPGSPSTPDQGLPSGKFWVVAGIPGIGWRYICVDPSLKPGNALPGTPPPTPGQGLPPAPPPTTTPPPTTGQLPTQPAPTPLKR